MKKLAAALAGAVLIAGPVLGQPHAGDAGKPDAPADATSEDEPGTGAVSQPAADKPDAPQDAEPSGNAPAEKPQV